MTEQWTDIEKTVDGKKARVHLDASAVGAPDGTLPLLLWAKAPIAKPDADGLSSKAEDEDLEDLRNVLRKVLEIRLHARFVGTITTAGHYELYFYGASADGLEPAGREALIDFEEYKLTYGYRVDADWSHVNSVMKA